jgi:Kef-type K+ transport system membrane component KefB
MLLPFAGGFWVTRMAGFSPLVSIFAGAALTATSISITARVLSELGTLSSREGQIILGAAVADDVLGLVVLAVVSQLAKGAGLDVAIILRSTALAIGFLLAALFLGIPVGHRLVREVGRARIRGVLVVASVAFAFLIAWGAQRAGSAPIVGAFAAGLVLARTNRRHDINTALRPVVDVFAPVFFVFVGAQVDLEKLNPFESGNRPALLLAAGLTLVGALGKFAAGFAAWGPTHRAFVGAGMLPRGEVGLIFASIGRATGGLPPEVFNAVVIAIFATTFLAPPLLGLLRPGRTGTTGRASAESRSKTP